MKPEWLMAAAVALVVAAFWWWALFGLPADVGAALGVTAGALGLTGAMWWMTDVTR